MMMIIIQNNVNNNTEGIGLPPMTCWRALM